MRFSTVFSVLACGAMAMAAAVSPAALVARSNNDIVKVIADLDVQVAVILPKFDSCHDSKCTEGLVLEVVAAVDVATAACVNLKGVADVDLAVKIAGIFIDIAVKLDDHKSKCNGECGDLSIYAKIDLCLSLLLAQLGICISGILTLVAHLLVDVVVILKDLGLTLILKVCLLI